MTVQQAVGAPAAAPAARLPRALLATAGLIVAIVAGCRCVLRQPGIPYNVSELFLDRAGIVALTFFAVAVLWFGAGAMLVARWIASSRRPYLVLPLGLVLVALVRKMLVSRGVTYESLDDILGTNNLFGVVVTDGAWGAWWRDVFLRLGPDLVDFIERRVRYTALYSLPTVCAALALTVTARASAPAASSASAPAAHDLDRFALWRPFALLCVAAGWTWLCGRIVLTWAATDNLTELIATAGPFGVPGPLYLLALLMVIAVNAAVLVAGTRSSRWALAAIVCVVAAIPGSWELLRGGLDQHVQKYGVVFPAQQFLLGPDRQHALTMSVLFVRWCGVYLAAVVAIAAGAWLADEIVGSLAVTSDRRPAAGAAS